MARGVELATGYVTLAAETSTLAKQVSGIFKGADTQASTAGRSMGKAMAKGFDIAKPNVDALAAEVTRAEQRVAAQAEASAKKQEAAKRKVEIAQAKLNEATEKFGPKSSQALTAVDRLATSEQKLESETLQAADAQNKLQSELKQSKDALGTASKSSEKASKVYAKGWKGVGQRVKGYLKGGVKQATDVAEDQAERGGKEAGGGFSSAFKGAIGGLAAGFSVAAVVGGIREVSDAAGAAEQSVGAIDSVFKGNSGAMHEWSKSAATAVGISGNEYRELGTLIGAQLKNAKTPMDELAGKTNDLITTGADLSSMFGGSTKEAVEALSSALKGEMDPIEKYGITLNEAALKSIALEKGLIESEVDAGKVSERTQKMALAQDKYNAAVAKYGKGSTQAKGAALALTSAENLLKDAQAGKIPSLDAATKAQAVQLAVAQQSADAQGNFAREEDTYEHKRQVAIASWQDMKEKIGGAFLPALAGAMGFVSDVAIPAIGTLTDGLKSAVGWVKENATWLVPLTVAVGAYVLALGGIAIVSKMKTMMAGLTAGQWRLNAAMSANPIGILVALIAGLIAAVVVLYKNNETARTIIDGAWTGIKNAVAVAWAAIKIAFSAIVGFVRDKLAPVFVWIYESIIKPYFTLIKTVIAVVITAVILLIKGLVWAWKNVLAPAIKWAWDNVLKPVFNVLGTFFKWVWETILKPAFDRVKGAFGGMVSGIAGFWNDKLKPVFQALGNFIRDKVAPVFKKGVDKIKGIWETIKEFAKAPISFVINTVINDGLIAAFNKVAGWIPGVNKLDRVKVPGFARGGWTGPGSKFQEAGVVHADEFVIKKESQRSLSRKAPGFLDSLNSKGASALGYAGGGLVKPVRGGQVTSGFGASRGRYPHAGIDFAVPTGTPVFASMAGTVLKAAVNAITGRTGIGAFLGHDGGRNTYYGHLSKLLVGVGDQVKKGQQIALSGNTGNSSGPHLHFETWTGGNPVNPAKYLSGAALPEGAETGSGGGGFNPLSFISDVAGKLVGQFGDRFPAGGQMVDIAKGIGGKLIGDVKAWASSKLAAIGDFGRDVAGDVGKSAGALKYRGLGAAALKHTGDSGIGNLNSLMRRMRQESGFDPRAINNWDSNAKRGTPSKGLMQVIDPTFAAYRDSSLGNDIWDPLQNVVASIRYAKSRYGSVRAGWDRKGGYSGGGLVDGFLHDQGGVHEPGTWSYNGLKKPEAVLNPRQWDIAASAVDQASGGFGSSDIDRLIHAVNDLANRPVDASLRIGQREFDGAVHASRKRSERMGAH